MTTKSRQVWGPALPALALRWIAGSVLTRPLVAASLAGALMLAGCGHVGHKPRGFETAAAATTPQALSTPRKIVIFFDGTANDEGSDTNVKRLHSLITLQNRPDIASLYVLGVGTELDPVGAVTGAGINARVRLGYEFILNHYRPKSPGVAPDEIYIFGFSRGAFTARILATMLNFAGIVKEVREEDGLRTLTPKELAEVAHAATFPAFGQGAADRTPQRADKLKAEFNRLCEWKNVCVRSVGTDEEVAVPVKVLGLWDSVQALGMPQIAKNVAIRFQSAPPKVDTDEPNPRYSEKLCNVERAYHAMSIDDNRATIFTPLLLSRAHLFEGCPGNKGMLKDGEIRPGALQEVWFSGAHADVGGGYATGALSGVSLNWMINRLWCDNLLPNSKCNEGKEVVEDVKHIREDHLGGSHDPTAGIFAFYPKVSRDLVAFSFDETSIWKGDPAPLCVHRSVVMRRGLIGTRPHEYDQLALEKPGTVALALGDYGKGRQWRWLRERKDADPPAVDKRVDVQVYPACQFMTNAVKVEGTK